MDYSQVLPFRQLSNEENTHTIIIDNRKVNSKKQNNSLIITCEHASNNFHHYENQASSSDLIYKTTHWGYDIGALEIATKISKQSETLMIYPNFSRLLLDPNRTLISNTLIRKVVEGHIKIDMNEESKLNRDERLSEFYYPYYSILNEVMSLLNPKFFISIHTFTGIYVDDPLRNYSIGLLYDITYSKSNRLVDCIEKRLVQMNISYKHNEPYTTEVHNGYNVMSSYDYPNVVTGLCVEIRNDLAVDKEFSDLISRIIVEVVNEVSCLNDDI